MNKRETSWQGRDQSRRIKANNVALTVEDHYPEGGLGDTIAGEPSSQVVRVHKLAVFDLPRSGKPDELFAKYGIDSAAIVRKVKALEGLALAERYERKGCTR